MNKPRPARRLSELATRLLADSFKRQGFASTELVTRWADIVGPEIASHAQPIRIQWRRSAADEPAEPATLVLRVEGPVAVEIQHLASVIVERVNRFFGWRAVGGIALRQAPLARRAKVAPAGIDPNATARVAATLGAVNDDSLRQALARLGAAVKKS